MIKASCEICGTDFWYWPAVRRRAGIMPRRKCGACLQHSKKEWERNKRKYLKRAKGEMCYGGRRSANGNITGALKATHQEIARKLNLSPAKVAEMERVVLLKIRNHAELKKLWGDFKEDGMALPVFSEIAGLSRSTGDALLDYQLEVAQWWEIYERLRLESSHGDGLPQLVNAELEECLDEIDRFQRQIGRTLNEMADGRREP